MWNMRCRHFSHLVDMMASAVASRPADVTDGRHRSDSAAAGASKSNARTDMRLTRRRRNDKACASVTRWGIHGHWAWALVVVALCLSACGGKPGGIHAKMLWSEESGLVVAELPREGHAWRAGLRPSDEILRIDGRDLSSLSMKEVLAALRGPVGSKVTVTIRRVSQEASPARGGESHAFRTLTLTRHPYRSRAR